MPSKKSELFLQKFAYENPDEVMAHGVAAARQCALLSIFYKQGWVWLDGVPVQKSEVKSAAKSARQYLKASWKNPLVSKGEDSIDGFLKNNMVAKVFMQSLVQTLQMARRPIKEANEIVKRAAEKMYPDYAIRVKAISKLASESVVEKNIPVNMEIILPHDESLLANLPSCMDEEWRELILEALDLPKRMVDQHGPKAFLSSREAKKWTEKMGKGLKKKTVFHK